jgi:multidrug efflux system membrane fusion protein
MNKGLVLCLVLAVAAGGAYWRDDLMVVASPYVTDAMAKVGFSQKTSAAELNPGGPAIDSTGQKAGKPGKTDSATAGASVGRRRGDTPHVATVAAVDEKMPILRKTIGTVVSPASLMVTSETQGLVTEVLVSDGADVRKGDVLVRLDSRIAAANLAKDKAALARDQASLEHAVNVQKRQQQLLSTDAVSKQSLEDAVTTVETAQATVALDQATVDGDVVTLAQKEIRAPFDGRLGSVGVVVGSLVQPGATVVRLTSLDPLQVSLTLAESDVALVQDTLAGGGAVEVTATPLGGDKTYDAKVDFVDANVDGPSGTFIVKATLANVDGRLFPGQSLAVTAILGNKPVVGVPSVALQPSQGGTIVYVVDGDGKVKVAPVTVALAAGDRSGIASGLAAGDRVVVEGQANLSAGLKVIDAAQAAQGGGQPAAEAKAEVQP